MAGIVDLINDLSVAQSTAPATRTQELGKDQFLKLLVEQLKNQDPLNPMENFEFIGELAQFNSLEQQINTNESLQSFISLQTLNQASMMLGTTVYYFDGEGNELSGIVESVEIVNGAPVLNVGGDQISLNDVTKISY